GIVPAMFGPNAIARHEICARGNGHWEPTVGDACFRLEVEIDRRYITQEQCDPPACRVAYGKGHHVPLRQRKLYFDEAYDAEPGGIAGQPTGAGGRGARR